MHGQQINNEGKRRAGGIPASWNRHEDRVALGTDTRTRTYHDVEAEAQAPRNQ